MPNPPLTRNPKRRLRRALARLFRAGLVTAAFAAASLGPTGHTADPPATVAAEFSGERAFEHLRKQCQFGPRPPGSEAHAQCLDYLEKTCRDLGLKVTRQTFDAYMPMFGKTMRLTNLIAVTQPDNPRRIMLSAHWDTRPVADQETDPARASMPILGANDGASGVAVLLELARVFRDTPPPVGLVFAFFDGEDAGGLRGGEFCVGSAYLARHLAPEWKFEKGINLDMVGDADLSLPIESHSWQKARPLVIDVWRIGYTLYPSTFISAPGRPIFDDHYAFLERGIPYIDIIDFEYPHWHTLEDTEDKCSPESLEKVGRVVARFVQSQK